VFVRADNVATDLAGLALLRRRILCRVECST